MRTHRGCVLVSLLATSFVACGDVDLLDGDPPNLTRGKSDTGWTPCSNAEEGEMQQAEGGVWLWNQPTADKKWNGQCGNTAAANYLLHACNWCLSPRHLNYAWDTLPGSRPSTVASLINNAGVCQRVKAYYGSTGDEATPRRLCAHADISNPVALLINQTGWKLKLHWINVLGCSCRLEWDGSWSGEVRYSTWGSVVTSSCDELRGWLDDIPWPYPASWVGK
jgi:hypothetical protein